MSDKKLLYEIRKSGARPNRSLDIWRNSEFLASIENSTASCDLMSKVIRDITALEEKLRVAVEALEFYGARENWVFSKSLPSPHIGIVRLTIIDTDKDIGLLSQGQYDDVGGEQARQALTKIKGDE